MHPTATLIASESAHSPAAVSLRAELPEQLDWLTESVRALVRPCAYLKESAGTTATAGSTRMHGVPDVPADAAWAAVGAARYWDQSPYDGESFWLQLNLEEVPTSIRKPSWPSVGVVWLFLNLVDEWKTVVRFDPRPAAQIPWRAAPGAHPGMSWVLQDSLCYCTRQTLPAISEVGAWAELYDDWVFQHYGQRRPSNVQVGGWVAPLQGDADARNLDVVCAIDRQSFGDSGAVYLHYSPEKGFFAYIETN